VPAYEIDDLADAKRGGQTGLLRGDPELPPAGRPARIAAEQLDPPRGDRPDAGEQAEQRALAGAVGAEQADQLAGRDVERDLVEREGVAVAAADLDGAGEHHGVSSNEDQPSVLSRVAGGAVGWGFSRACNVSWYCSKASRPRRVSRTKVAGVRPWWVLVTST
jgi:hypothetical protein